MRFNPPPSWPRVPAGWTPPPGWQPDPAWGPPPPGWSLWVDDAAPPATAAYPTASYQQTPYTPGGAPGGGGHRTALLAVAGVVVVALVAAGVVLLVNRGGDETPVAAPTTTAPATTTDGASSSSAPSSSRSTTASPSTSAAAVPAGILALGTAAPVGEYTVTVTSVDLDATAAVTAEDSTNTEPTNGRYVLVAISATYNGAGKGDAYLDLYADLLTDGGQDTRGTSCFAFAPDDLVRTDELSTGETATGNLCLDVDPAAIPGSTVTITDDSFDPGPVWTTGG